MFYFSTTKVAILSKIPMDYFYLFSLSFLFFAYSINIQIFKMENFLSMHFFHLFDILILKNIFGKLSIFIKQITRNILPSRLFKVKLQV